MGVREYLERAPALPGMPAAAFDTKVDKFLAGSAARRIQRHLRRLGCRIAVPAQSFLVSVTAAPLGAREEEKARRWGAALASTVIAAHHPV